jgi:tetratricopeptide (TPR) repeat protein
MIKRILPTILLAFVFFAPVVAQKIDPPKLTPTPATESQAALIKEGVALHNRGDYDGAIAKYEQVLRENPANDLALYELAFAYEMKKDYRKSLETAYKGAQYKSDHLGEFYIRIGNNLDLLGESKKAVEVYKQAIKIKPGTPLLYYNLGVTYNRLNNVEEAKKNIKKELYISPSHASSHIGLAQLFHKTNYKVPALFAVMRFLVLEPKSQRANDAHQAFIEMLRGGASAGKNPGEISIFLDLGGKKDEGDFGSIELVLGLTGAVGATEKNKDKSDAEKLVDQLDTLLALISEQDAKGDKSKFTFRYYIPYFNELKKRDYVEPFAYHISQSSKMSGVADWLQANSGRVKEFLIWSEGYQWPKE